MLCSNCGKPLSKNASFCESCGTPVIQVEKNDDRKLVPIGEFEELEQKLSTAYAKLEKSNRVRNVLVGVLVFLVVLVSSLLPFMGK